jgi:phytoene/squalene synthetase
MSQQVIMSPRPPAEEISPDRRARDRASVHADIPENSVPAVITRAASKQTYYTIRLLVDRERTLDAYRAYAYFRWVDDWLDKGASIRSERLDFIAHQRALIDDCYRDACPPALTVEERMLADLIRGDRDSASGLRSYIFNMMAVMAFDAERRGHLISRSELASYTGHLAAAVTDALHYFVGHGQYAPRGDSRYLAATAAHITHMLRDTIEDVGLGYFNVPVEFLDAYHIHPWDVGSEPYRAWVESRVCAARASFKAGEAYLAQVENLRCRLAGYAYMARFTPVLDAIERDGYRLRPAYPDCEGLRGGLRASWSLFAGTLGLMPHSRPAAL